VEYAEKGDLLAQVMNHLTKRIPFPEDEIWRTLIQTINGLKALHDKKILHRDIKSANIFVTKDNIVKLGDLNVSKIAKKRLLYTQTGTPYYASPEIWKDKPYDAKSDMWSLGCVIYEMAALRPPFKAQDMQGLFRKVVAGVYSEIPRYYSNELSQVIRALLQVNPMLRPTCQSLLEMNAVKNKAKELGVELHSEELIDEKAILGTIVFSRQVNALSHRLPKPNYAPSIQQVGSIARSNTSDGPRKNHVSDALETVNEEKAPSERSSRSRQSR
jgi:NIMA (never in mitosis gene a)-related kinase